MSNSRLQVLIPKGLDPRISTRAAAG